VSELRDLRLSPADVEALRWFLCEAEGALGLQSNWEAAVNAALPGRNKGSKPVSAARNFGVAEARVEAASRARWVARIWGRIGRTHRRTLEATYGPALAPGAAARWGWLADGDRSAPLLLVTAERQGLTRADLRGWLPVVKVKATADHPGRPGRGLNRKALGELHEEAEVALVLASRAWRQARQEER
jgi:hypothetical protein